MFDVTVVLQDLKLFYFTPAIFFIAQLTALSVCLHYKQKNTISKLFAIFITLDILILCLDYGLQGFHLLSTKQLSRFINISNTLIAIAELATYSYYFSVLLNQKKISLALVAINLFYLLLCSAFFITEFSFLNRPIVNKSFLLSIVEFIFLIPLCLVYYKKLLAGNRDVALLQRPSFWLTSGLLFYSAISITFYLLAVPLLIKHRNYFPIFSAVFYYIPLTVHFLCISKAFLCKKPLTI